MKRPASPQSSQESRLQKVLAAAGLGSRRACEELIVEGRVEVDRRIVTELGTRVDPSQQQIRVDGVPLKQEKKVYFAVHKPTGVLSTGKDQWRRTRVVDLVDSKQRLFTIGRLDKDSSGLILVTNDGELANLLTHPRYQVAKTYRVTVAGFPSRDVIQKLRRGVVLADGRVRADSITVKKRLQKSTILEIVLTEGRNREIRRMLARFDHKVMQLERIAIGPIRLGMLPRGAHRELTREEVKKLRSPEAGRSLARSRRGRSSQSAGPRAGSFGATRKGAQGPKSRGRGSSGSKASLRTKALPSIEGGGKVGTVIGADEEGQRERKPKATTSEVGSGSSGKISERKTRARKSGYRKPGGKPGGKPAKRGRRTGRGGPSRGAR